jgi:hypothetical protein
MALGRHVVSKGRIIAPKLPGRAFQVGFDAAGGTSGQVMEALESIGFLPL